MKPESKVEENVSAADWIREHLGCRCLIQGTDQVWESAIQELSPCDRYARLTSHLMHGRDYGWVPVEEVQEHLLCVWPKGVES